MEYNYNEVNQSHMSKEMVALMLNNLIKEVKDSENANNLMIKVEENFEIENNPLGSLTNTYINGIKLEPEVIKQMKSVEVVENSIFGRTYCKVAGTVAYIGDHSYCKASTAQYKSKAFSSKQLVVLLETAQNSSTVKSEILEFPGVVYDDWKIKNEEVDLKEEDLVSLPSGLSEQEKYDIYKNTNTVKSHLLRQKNPKGVYLFRCDKCEYVTRYQCVFKSHLQLHKNPGELDLFRCDKCKYRTRVKGNLKKHLLRHQSPEEVDLFRCDKCEYQTRRKSNLKSHLLRHQSLEGVDLLRCDKCQFVTRHKNSFKNHSLRHENPEEVNLFKCDKCEYRTLLKNKFKQHLLGYQRPEEVDLLRCDKCKYRTRLKQNLKRHLLTHQCFEEVDLLRCDECKYRTPFRRNLKQHLLSHQRPEEVDLLRCDKCKYRTRFKRHFKRHFLTLKHQFRKNRLI